MTDTLNKRTIAIGSLLLAILNFLTAWGVGLPAWATTEALTLLQGAALSIVSAVAYVLHRKAAS